MELADSAIVEDLRGNASAAKELHYEAFRLEREAARAAAEAILGEPTTSILWRSAATLALDCGEIRESERLIATALAQDPPEAIANELRDLLEQVHFRRHLELRGITLNPAEFQFSLIGAAVGFGIVNSDDFVERVHTVETLVYRTAERKLKKPFREAGRRKKSIQNDVDLFLTVPRAASFAVTFRIGSSVQLSLLPGTHALAEQVVDEVLTCVEMLDRGDEESIRARIDEPAYFRNFVSLAAKIAPDGKDITGVGFTALGPNGKQREVALRRPRKQIPAIVSASPPPSAIPTPAGGEAIVTGRLEWASNLNQENEIRIVGERGEIFRVLVPAGLMNDIVKPLWDERVTATGTRKEADTIVLATIERAD